MENMEISRILGVILIAIGVALFMYDVITNRIRRLWPIILFLVCPGLFGLFLLLNEKDFLIYFAMVIAIGTTWFWVENLYEKINGKEIDKFKSILGRIGVAVIGAVFIVVFRFLLYPTMALFLSHVETFVKIPKLVSIITTFCAVYVLTILSFGLLYATLHCYLNNAGFHSGHHLKLQDFFFFSAFNIATQSYKDMMPDHWLVSLLSLIQIFVGIVLLGIYLAGAFTYIVSP